MALTFSVMDIENAGPHGRLIPGMRNRPTPGTGEILIEVHGAGVNGADVKQLHGRYPGQERAPSVPGLEVSGIVAACGPGVTAFRPGDAVCALVFGGGYGEYCIAPAMHCLPVPEGMSILEAAALPEVVFTVWIALYEQCRLLPGETVLVHGGASGIGTMAIQMAKCFGSTVIATGRGADRAEICLRYGADEAIDTKAADFAARVMTLTKDTGVDVILDMAGASYFKQNLACMAPYGRLCFIAADGGRELECSVHDISLRGIYVTGINLRHRSAQEKARIADIVRKRVWPSLSSGKIKPVIGKTMPLRDAAEALSMLEHGGIEGKIVLKVR